MKKQNCFRSVMILLLVICMIFSSIISPQNASAVNADTNEDLVLGAPSPLGETGNWGGYAGKRDSSHTIFTLEKNDKLIFDMMSYHPSWKNAPFTEINIDRDYNFVNDDSLAFHNGSTEVYTILTRVFGKIAGVNLHYRQYSEIPGDVIVKYNLKPSNYHNGLKAYNKGWYTYYDSGYLLGFDVYATNFGTGVYSVGNVLGAAYKNFIINYVDVHRIQFYKPFITTMKYLDGYIYEINYKNEKALYTIQYDANTPAKLPHTLDRYFYTGLGPNFSHFAVDTDNDGTKEKIVTMEELNNASYVGKTFINMVYDYNINLNYITGSDDVKYHQGNSNHKTETVKTGDDYLLTEEQLKDPPKRDGYIFKGWYTFNNHEQQVGLSSLSPDLSKAILVHPQYPLVTNLKKHIEVYAVYEKAPEIPISWTETANSPTKEAVEAMYRINDLPDSIELHELDSSNDDFSNGSNKTFELYSEDLPPSFTTEKRVYDDKTYTFTGWRNHSYAYSNIGILATVPIRPFSTDDKNLNIYPTWQVEDRTESGVKVTLNANGGKLPNDLTSPHVINSRTDVHYDELPTPTRERHQFLGWEDADGNLYQPSTFFTKGSRFYDSIELFARWKAYPTFQVIPVTPPAEKVTIEIADITDTNIPDDWKKSVKDRTLEVELNTQMSTMIDVESEDGSTTQLSIYDMFLSSIPPNPEDMPYSFVGKDNEHYIFSHYEYIEGGNTKQFDEATEFTTAGTIKLIPIFDLVEKDVKVTYMYDGKEIETVTYAKGEDIVLPNPPKNNNPETTGFNDWYIDGVSADTYDGGTEDGKIEYNKLRSRSDYSNITINANFVELVTIDFDTNNSDAFPEILRQQDIKVIPNSKDVELPLYMDKTTENSVVEHAGWLYKDASTPNWELLTRDHVFTTDTTLRMDILAKSTATAEGAVITFDLNHEEAEQYYSEGIESQTVYGTALTNLPLPISFESLNTTYSFEGWHDEDNNLVKANTIFTEDTTLKAQWTEKNNATDYIRISFDLNNPDVEAVMETPQHVEMNKGGQIFGLPEYPYVKTGDSSGYMFEGFYLEETDPKTLVTESTTFDENTTIYASWSDSSLYETSSPDGDNDNSGSGQGTNSNQNNSGVGFAIPELQDATPAIPAAGNENGINTNLNDDTTTSEGATISDEGTLPNDWILILLGIILFLILIGAIIVIRRRKEKRSESIY